MEEEDKKVILRWQNSASTQPPSLCALVLIGAYAFCLIPHVYSEHNMNCHGRKIRRLTGNKMNRTHSCIRTWQFQSLLLMFFIHNDRHFVDNSLASFF